jgi:cytochrome c oxidase subunit 2
VLDATKPGRYRGECYEFCGLQHAHMGMWVVAQPPAEFRRWLAAQAKPATAGGPGRAVFLSEACANCHQIRGTPADANVGPDLTHLQARLTIAASTLPNTRDALHRWVLDPQHEKPGARMPALPLTQRQQDQLFAYLERLR